MGHENSRVSSSPCRFRVVHLSAWINSFLRWVWISTLSDWFKKLAPFSQLKRSQYKTNRDLLTFFPALLACYTFVLWVLIGSLGCLCPLSVCSKWALSQEEPNMRRSESCLCRIDFTYSVVGFWLVSAFRIMLCLTALHCFFQEHKSAKTVGEMKQYVQKIPFMQRAKASLATRE